MSHVTLDTTYETLQVGAQPNDGTGTDLRGGGIIINTNFTKTIANLTAINTALAGLDPNARAVSSSNTVIDLPTSETLDQGRVVSIGSTGVVYADHTSSRVPIGVTMAASSGGEVQVAVSGEVEISGVIRGGIYFLDANGTVSASATRNIFQVGVGTRANTLLIAPQVINLETSQTIDDYVLTQNGVYYHRALTVREHLLSYNPVNSEYPYTGSQGRSSAEWIISNATGTTTTMAVINYANNNNNSGVTSLADAWNSRTTLTYEPLINIIF